MSESLEFRKKKLREELKVKLKNNRRLRTLFFNIVKISVKPDIFDTILDQIYEFFKIDYRVEKLFYDNWTGMFRKTYIGYFYLSVPQNFNIQKKNLQNFFYSILEWILKEQCIKNNSNYNQVLNSLMFNQSLKLWLEDFSRRIIDRVCNYMQFYHANLNEIYNDSFIKRENILMVNPNSDYLVNDQKNKLFQEMKISQAEKYYTSLLKQQIKLETREVLIDEYQKAFDTENERIEQKIEELLN